MALAQVRIAGHMSHLLLTTNARHVVGERGGDLGVAVLLGLLGLEGELAGDTTDVVGGVQVAVEGAGALGVDLLDGQDDLATLLDARDGPVGQGDLGLLADIDVALGGPSALVDDVLPDLGIGDEVVVGGVFEVDYGFALACQYASGIAAVKTSVKVLYVP